MPEPLRLVFIDNFDSFTWNLVDEFARRGAGVEVWRNTVAPEHALERARSAPRSLLVLSPGPGAPAGAGCCVPLVRLAAAAGVPLFGVCLGHQAMVEACAMVEPAFILNTVLAPDKRIMAAFCGHWREAHEAGCSRVLARSAFVQALPALLSAAPRPEKT